MKELSTLLLLACAVSLDSFMVAFTYGLRQMKLAFQSVIMIGLISGTVFLCAMALGDWLGSYLSEKSAEMIGGGLLVLIGIWVLVSFFRSDSSHEKTEPYEIKFEIKSLGIVIQILKKPMMADMDESGNIAGIEVFILGLALSLDSLGAGIGAALIGLPVILSAIGIGVATSLFLSLGLKSGVILSGWQGLHRFNFLPGLILIIIGVVKMIG
ncbi:sporulation membrane protein YtaF [Paraliobacillus sediminis]|uniref:sporulation membrane protein YtaF n=1 Tax=Paraliobacillus sediminis TaxID=1885916 RepID=UPI000E3C941D|nr:sporulation membrane protein YtaF [Paraliobacillus sediminis]